MTRPKLLLADDSVTIRKVVELTFADEGIDVTTVADGEAAMSQFGEVHPDIVLVDVGLPEINGYDFCEIIKGDETTSHIPVLLLVGSFEPFDQDAAQRSGADGFLTKPFHSIRDLVNRVHELLGTQGSKDQVIDFATVSEEDAGDADDIDDLYERSFAETVQIDDSETMSAFPEEMEIPVDEAGEVPKDEKLEKKGKRKKGRKGKNTEDGENASTAEQEEITEATDDQVSETAPSEETVDASHHSVDEWLDDEMIEAVTSAPAEELQAAEKDAVDAVSQYENAPAAAVDIEPIKEFDWSPAAIVTAADEREIGAAAGFGSSFDPEETLIPTAVPKDEHITEELTDLKTDEMPELSTEQPDGHSEGKSETATESGASGASTISELSPELVELITRRVVERLSDRAVREVAQEAVPRIAEKLMREALEEDKNK